QLLGVDHGRAEGRTGERDPADAESRDLDPHRRQAERGRVGRGVGRLGERGTRRDHATGQRDETRALHGTLLKCSVSEWRVWLRRNARGRRDRKSTRLNSSHVKISYAVFCLKKKKKN